MPIYEYECLKCHRVHEVTQRISDKPISKCPTPKCGGKVKKLVSMSSFALKGSGWYTSDYKRAGTKPATEETKAEAKADVKVETKSEAKTDAKSESGSEAPSVKVPSKEKKEKTKP